MAEVSYSPESKSHNGFKAVLALNFSEEGLETFVYKDIEQFLGKV